MKDFRDQIYCQFRITARTKDATNNTFLINKSHCQSLGGCLTSRILTLLNEAATLFTLTTGGAVAACGGNPEVGGAGVKEDFKDLRRGPDANLSIVCHLFPK